MNKKALFFVHFSILLFSQAENAPTSPKKLSELSPTEYRALRADLKRIKAEPVDVEPVLEAGEYVELQGNSDLMNVDPETHLVLDSVSRCQLRVDWEAFKKLAASQKRVPADGLILSPTHSKEESLRRLIKISGEAVSKWEGTQVEVPLKIPNPSEVKLILTYPLDDSRGLLKELVCTYSAEERDFASIDALKNIEQNLKGKVLQTDLISTLRNLDRLNFITNKEARAADPVIGDSEKASDKAKKHQDLI